ncbi:Uncharacterised protein [uncultured archaeon]|nr:Uncharacterised protein [uncultured archaeon]
MQKNNDEGMNKELYRPVIKAIAALFLIVLIKLAALLTLKQVSTFYTTLDIILSLAVIIILLRFRRDFNLQLGISLPGFPEAQAAVSGLILLLVILTLYETFSPFLGLLPYGVFNIVFFILALIPVYSLWNLVYKNSDRFLDLIGFIPAEGKKICSCGWENPGSNKFCGKCGSPLP